ncbi:putative secreted protein [Cryptosporidium hominis]
MKISIKICIALISCFTILILFLQFNTVYSESVEPIDEELDTRKSPNLGIESSEIENKILVTTRRSSFDLMVAKSFRERRESSKSSETSLSSKEEEITKIEKEIETNLFREIITVVIMEFETFVFKSGYLFLTNFWLDMRSNFDNIDIVKGLVDFWGGEESEDLYPSLVSFFYKENMKRLKMYLYPSFDKKPKPKKKLLKDFLYNAYRLSCQDSKKSLAILILMFQREVNLVYTSYLLFLISCSHKDFYQMEFVEIFQLILHNTDFAENKILSIADKNVDTFITFFKKKLKIENSNLPSNNEIKTLNPLNMHRIDFEIFGLSFCESLLEISILKNVIFLYNYLIFLFGSRFSKPEEVLIATDIFKFVSSSATTTTEIIAMLLFNESTFTSLKSKMFSLHGVDISALKNRFKECIQKIDSYRELNGIRFLTDFQEKSTRRNDPNELIKNRLRSKFAFLT